MSEKITQMPNNAKQRSYGKIVIDDGTVEEVIYNTFGDEIGRFRFRPTDMEIVNRYDEVVDRFDEILKPLENTGINPDGTADEESGEDGVATLNKVRDALFEQFNYIFDTDWATAFFKTRSPFAIINGDFYCGNVMDVIGRYIANAFDIEVKKVNRKYDRYTKQYHGQRTGKHKNGGKKGSK